MFYHLGQWDFIAEFPQKVYRGYSFYLTHREMSRALSLSEVPCATKEELQGYISRRGGELFEFAGDHVSRMKTYFMGLRNSYSNRVAAVYDKSGNKIDSFDFSSSEKDTETKNQVWNNLLELASQTKDAVFCFGVANDEEVIAV